MVNILETEYSDALVRRHNQQQPLCAGTANLLQVREHRPVAMSAGRMPSVNNAYSVTFPFYDLANGFTCSGCYSLEDRLVQWSAPCRNLSPAFTTSSGVTFLSNSAGTGVVLDAPRLCAEVL